MLHDAVEDANASVAGAALGALVERELPGAFTMLAERFARTPDVEWRLRRTIVDLAARMGDDRAFPFLVGAARGDTETRVRARALSHLARRSDPHAEVAYRLLCEALHDASHHVRGAAARGLGLRGDARALPHLRARRQIEIDPTVLGALRGALARLERPAAGDA